jgi:hypothetical protein
MHYLLVVYLFVLSTVVISFQNFTAWLPFSFLAALPPSLNFLTVTGEFSEDQMLTASYGYIGGYEGKSLYSWYLHEVFLFSCSLVNTDTQ